jgi:hypothetical protein
MFLSGVAPILDYCSGVWGCDRHHNIESVHVHYRALRNFLDVHMFTPILAIQGESG